jgi:uncharacterized membrane protein
MNLGAALTCGAVLWLTLLVASPLAASSGRMPGLTFAAYRAGSIVCHQRPERSFHLAGVQLPVCARCFGLYLSGAMGLVAASIGARRAWPAPAIRAMLGLAALPIGVTVTLEWLGLIETTNLVRMLTGVLLGFAAGFVIISSLRGVPRPGHGMIVN